MAVWQAVMIRVDSWTCGPGSPLILLDLYAGHQPGCITLCGWLPAEVHIHMAARMHAAVQEHACEVQDRPWMSTAPSTRVTSTSRPKVPERLVAVYPFAPFLLPDLGPS
jgi:hypothetical protein